MNRLHGVQAALRAESISLPQFHNEALTMRQVAVGFGMPCETLLGVICHSVQNAKTAGRFFARLHAMSPEPVKAYLGHFVLRLSTELDFGDPGLVAKEAYRNTPMDFLRPSPTRGFALPAFFAELVTAPNLHDLASPLPLRLPKSEGPNPGSRFVHAPESVA